MFYHHFHSSYVLSLFLFFEKTNYFCHIQVLWKKKTSAVLRDKNTSIINSISVSPVAIGNCAAHTIEDILVFCC